MKTQGNAEVLLRFFRSILLIDLSLVGLVSLTGVLLGWHTFQAYDIALMWTGTALIFFSCLIGMGGLASRLEDVSAFQRSRAGNMSENMRRIAEAGQSSLGCFLILLIAGVGLVILSYFLSFIVLLFK